ncbi:MAG: hypothetical protein EH225_09750 [Calditrichaeota bacterium]|nr:hypothetical protein [Calditrichota bacterium]RQW01140.1 MAG: hypothetical protein EH225_09750 [Calditrichota bacterium]
MKKVLLILLSLSTLAILIQCGEKEPEGLKEAKLDSRQKIDETLLQIDKKLESLHGRLKPDIPTEQRELKTRIDMLQDVRERLVTQYEAIDTVKSKNWDDLKQRIGGTISMVKDTLDSWSVDIEEMPQPRAYP